MWCLSVFRHLPPLVTDPVYCTVSLCSDPLSFSALQGLMFGYATDETEECMPLTIVLAHKLNSKMAELRRNGTIPWLRPDSKTQVNFFFFFLLYYGLKATEFFL